MSRLRSVIFVVAVAMMGPLPARAGTTPVTIWTDEADGLGFGNANWRTLAIMHMAMHDALNAADPVFDRWSPRTADEPSATGALPQAALEAAAASVLTALHPRDQSGIQELLAARVATMPPGPARDAGLRLGQAVGEAAAARRRGDGFERVGNFPGSEAPGVWRPTPPSLRTSGKTETRPFLFADPADVGAVAPPEPGGPLYLSDVAEVREIGGAISPVRTPAQADLAIFWAYQSTQRGMIHLAATMTETEHSGLARQARLMSQVSAAMADSAITIWHAKAYWNYWRPVTAIRSGLFGVLQDAEWSSFIETPPHPEYPSGHASDCYTGALFLQAVSTTEGPFTYEAKTPKQSDGNAAKVWVSDMGDPPAPVELVTATRPFASLAEAAQLCADSRIWAGAHFRSANEESRRIATRIVERALAAVPPLPPTP